MNFLDNLLGRKAKERADLAKSYAIKRGSEAGVEAALPIALNLAGSSDGPRLAAAVAKSLEEGAPRLPPGFPRPFEGTPAVRREEIARASLSQSGLRLESFSPEQRGATTEALCGWYATAFDLAVKELMESVAAGTFMAEPAGAIVGFLTAQDARRQTDD